MAPRSLSSISRDTFDAFAWLLDNHGDYRVLRRFEPEDGAQFYAVPPAEEDQFSGLFVDVETTGLGDDAKIIELALVPFTFDRAGRIIGRRQPIAWLNDPGIPIPPEVVELTGITDERVKGTSIDPESVRPYVEGAQLIVAHNAAFDRTVLERELPVGWDARPWGCSYMDVPWRDAGVDGAKLVHVLMQACNLFYDAHRAGDDCLAAIHALATADVGGTPAFARLLANVRAPHYRLWAIDAPFEVKDRLKARGYRWNAEARAGRPKAWYKDIRGPGVGAPELEVEREWLAAHAHVKRPGEVKIGPTDRYSLRG